MSATHFLKTWPQYWEAVQRGDKNFEVRKDDRAYQAGDTLVLERYDPAHPEIYGTFGRISKRVTFVLPGGQFGVEPGYVVMGLADAEEAAS